MVAVPNRFFERTRMAVFRHFVLVRFWLETAYRTKNRTTERRPGTISLNNLNKKEFQRTKTRYEGGTLRPHVPSYRTVTYVAKRRRRHAGTLQSMCPPSAYIGHGSFVR